MPTRFSASVGYAGGAVGVEIDVFAVSDKEKDDSGRWRDQNGRFTSPPDIDAADVEREAGRVQEVAARNMRSRELGRAINQAELSIEDGELVGERGTDGTRNVVRIDPHGDGNYIRYVVEGGNLRRLG